MNNDILIYGILFRGQVVELQILGPDSVGVKRGGLLPDLLTYLSEHKAEIIEAACKEEWEQWQAERPAPNDDPRPDLMEDSEQWARLLEAAYEQDGDNPTGAWAALHGVRCLGAVIINQKSKWKLASGEEYDLQEWADHRARYLAPHTEVIRQLLVDVRAGILAEEAA